MHIKRLRAELLIRAVALAVAGVAMAAGAAVATPQSDAFHSLMVFADVRHAAEQLHVTPVDDRKVIEAAAKGLMRSLDAYSTYLTPAEYEHEIRSAQLAGVGLTTSATDGVPKVVHLDPDGPAARGGVQLGDYVVAIDGRRTFGEAENWVWDQVQGTPGAPVNLSLIRNMRERLELTLTREPKATAAVQSRMVGDYGYVRVTYLGEGSGAQASAAATALMKHAPNLKGMIVDLRGCPGGLLDESLAVASDFLDSGAVVFTQKGGQPQMVDQHRAKGGDQLHGLPMTVLIDGGTESGAEIIAAALQDNGRAAVVGTPSQGQGTVQSIIPISGGRDGAVRITVALLYRPSDKPIDGVGVAPDMVVAAAGAGRTDPTLASAISAMESGSVKALVHARVGR